MLIVLRVLMIEAYESDADLILSQLKNAGYEPQSERVVTLDELQAAIRQQEWDLLISDYQLPTFEAPAVLDLLHKSGLDVPFIVVSGTIGEETAAALMRLGAHDYLKKDNLTRLGAVVDRELLEARRRAGYRRAEELVRESEQRYRMLFENSPIALCEMDLSRVKIYLDQLVSNGAVDILTYFSENPGQALEVVGLARVLDVNQTALGLYHADNKQELLAYLARVVQDDPLGTARNELLMIASGRHTFNYETVQRTLDGDLIDVSLHWAVVSGHEQDLERVILSVQDISPRKNMERRLQQSEARQRKWIELMPACVYTEAIDGLGEITYISPQIESFTGYAPEEWFNRKDFWNTIIHPDDRELVRALDEKTDLSGEPFRAEYRVITRDERVVWLRDDAVLLRDDGGTPLFWLGVIQDVSLPKKAELEIKESQRRLAQLMSSLPGMAYRTRPGSNWALEFASEGCLQLTGYTSEELTAGEGMLLTRMIHPDDLENEHDIIQSHLETQTPFQVSYRIFTPRGEQKWVWEQGQGIFDLQGENSAVEGFIADITELKQAEAAIHRHLSEQEVLYQNSLVINRLMEPRQIAAKVVEILGEKMNWHHIAVRLFNVGTQRLELLAADGEQIEGQDLVSYGALDHRPEALSLWVFEHGVPALCPNVREDTRYEEIHPEVRSGVYVPLRTGERIIGTISLESNLENAFSERDERLLSTIANQAAISIENSQLFLLAQVELVARKEAETQLLQVQSRLEQRVAERTADLKEANLALEKAARMKDEFMASMSHELRTPLTGILGLTDVLQMQTYGSLSDKQLMALQHIANSGRHLLELINDILDLARIEARQLVLRLGLCRLEQICQSCLRQVSVQANHKKLEISLQMSPQNINVQADAQRLKQVLNNLLSNALKFTAEGGRIGVDVRGDLENHEVHITVWDTGIGIRAEDISRLFQNFVQLDSSLGRQYNGTGLGLVLVKRLTELQGGRIDVESKYGEGSRFTISLPWDG
jgi:PAS domain S-box-containing protein